ncbi:S-layer homology domain-containing protein [Marinicrinis lubricantis]|uniref:S-layer homology domain-containing protein n=1 Tax=Marinicrinis lubricantis TaxID=2086470 RepID=A0ABW1IR60_9BACL
MFIVHAADKNDIQGHWSENIFSEWISEKLISGYPDGSFRLFLAQSALSL